MPAISYKLCHHFHKILTLWESETYLNICFHVYFCPIKETLLLVTESVPVALQLYKCAVFNSCQKVVMLCCIVCSQKHLMWRKACRSSWYQTTTFGCRSPSFSSSWRKHWHRRKARLCLSYDDLFHLCSHGKNWPRLGDKDSIVSRLKMSWTKIRSIQRRFLYAKVRYCISLYISVYSL